MSHLVLKKVDGKWKTYDKNKKKSEGPSFSDYTAGKEYQEKRDAREDKKPMHEFKSGDRSKKGPVVKSRKPLE
jgi:hypothetical protein